MDTRQNTNTPTFYALIFSTDKWSRNKRLHKQGDRSCINKEDPHDLTQPMSKKQMKQLQYTIFKLVAPSLAQGPQYLLYSKFKNKQKLYEIISELTHTLLTQNLP